MNSYKVFIAKNRCIMAKCYVQAASPDEARRKAREFNRLLSLPGYYILGLKTTNPCGQKLEHVI